MPVEVAEFLDRRRDALVARWLNKVRSTLPGESSLTDEQLEDSLSLFFDEIVAALAHHRGGLLREQGSPVAKDHGSQRQLLQRSIGELVREYGLLLECISEVAEETKTSLSERSLFDLTKYLFSAAAVAVEVYAERQEVQQRRADFESFAFVAHELRSPLSSARTAWELICRKGELDSRRAQVVDRSLGRLMELIDHAITQARLSSPSSGIDVARERIDLDALVEDLLQECIVDAEAKSIRVVHDRGPALAIDADHRLLRSALANLIRNALKFTHEQGQVTVHTRRAGDRLLIQVEDECGGLALDRAERLFEKFVQSGRDRSGFGLGLAISKQAIEAHGGTLSVKNSPGKGCVFTIDLPAGDQRANTP